MIEYVYCYNTKHDELTYWCLASEDDRIEQITGWVNKWPHYIFFIITQTEHNELMYSRHSLDGTTKMMIELAVFETLTRAIKTLTTPTQGYGRPRTSRKTIADEVVEVVRDACARGQLGLKHGEWTRDPETH